MYIQYESDSIQTESEIEIPECREFNYIHTVYDQSKVMINLLK